MKLKRNTRKKALIETGKSIEALEKNQDKLKLDKPKEIAKVLDPNREVYEEETLIYNGEKLSGRSQLA